MGTEKRIGKETAERGKSNGSTGPIARKSIPIAYLTGYICSERIVPQCRTRLVDREAQRRRNG
jgi:hypothetical protein